MIQPIVDFTYVRLRGDDEQETNLERSRLARERLDAAAAVRNIRVMSGCVQIVAATITIPFGGMSGGRVR
ncbi:MAG: hypothetical protein JOZ11_08225 [Alphaproteobacteria bacterium]|nr:hypothetical protein [Alphaproteobacteria bacterium]